MSKRQIPRAMFEPLEDLQAADLLDNAALLTLVKKEAPLAIEEALKNKKTFATLFEISGTGYYLDIPKNYWIPALEQCIVYKLEEEDFEDCVKIKNLIEDIKKPTKTLTNKPLKQKKNGTRTDRDSTSDK